MVSEPAGGVEDSVASAVAASSGRMDRTFILYCVCPLNRGRISKERRGIRREKRKFLREEIGKRKEHNFPFISLGSQTPPSLSKLPPVLIQLASILYTPYVSLQSPISAPYRCHIARQYPLIFF